MAKYIMIQGSNSNVGKTTIAAGLCRLLTRKGYKVAPFKASNVGLNSYIDTNNGEMGYGQALQAFACNLKPEAIMNPLLIKPKGNGYVDIVLNGKQHKVELSQISQTEKIQYLPIIKESLQKVSEGKDIVVIEGGGSPAEINIPKPDLANMAIALEVKAPVILVGNIELGGVFASIYGTYALLEKEEQDLIKGFIINKLHGSAMSLTKGTNILEDKMNASYLGVVPYENIDLDDEDLPSVYKYNNKAQLSVKVLKTRMALNLNSFKQLSNYTHIDLNLSLNSDSDILIIPASNALEKNYKNITINKIPSLIITFENGKELLDNINLTNTKVINYDKTYLSKNDLKDLIAIINNHFDINDNEYQIIDDYQKNINELDKLADVLEKNLDIEKIITLM